MENCIYFIIISLFLLLQLHVFIMKRENLKTVTKKHIITIIKQPINLDQKWHPLIEINGVIDIINNPITTLHKTKQKLNSNNKIL